MRKAYTVMVVPGETSRIRRFRLPRIVVTGFVAATFACLAALALLLADYVEVKGRMAELEGLRREAREQRQQLTAFAGSITELQEEMVRLRQFDTKLRVMTDLEQVVYPEQIMGVGGVNTDPFNAMQSEVSFQEDSVIRSMNEGLTRLATDASLQERSFQELVEYLEDQKSLLASTPSVWPVKGWLTSSFGYRRSPFTGRREMHKGIDVATRTGTPIIAPADGLVVFSGREGGYGNMVMIDHGYGIVTRFGHCSELDVKSGDKVNRGDVVAKVGNTGRSTGPHVHYEVMVNGVTVNPMRYILN